MTSGTFDDAKKRYQYTVKRCQTYYGLPEDTESSSDTHQNAEFAKSTRLQRSRLNLWSKKDCSMPCSLFFVLHSSFFVNDDENRKPTSCHGLKAYIQKKLFAISELGHVTHAIFLYIPINLLHYTWIDSSWLMVQGLMWFFIGGTATIFFVCLYPKAPSSFKVLYSWKYFREDIFCF